MSDKRIVLGPDLAVPAVGVITNSHTEVPTSKAVYDAIAASSPINIVIDLTSAQIKNLVATPVTLIAAPGAGKVIDIVSCTSFLDFTTPAYDTSSTDALIKVGGTIVTIPTAHIKASADAVARPLVPTAAAVPTVNTACTISVASTEYATGNSTMRISLSYRIVTLF